MAFSSPPLGAVVSDLCQAKKQPAQPSDADWMGEAGWHEFHGFLEWFLSRRSTETRYLIEETWQPGRYTEFHIYEPKQRLISAAPFPDRVVHHAVMNVLEPVFEPTFVFDSYACRPRSVGCQPAACRPRSVGCQPAAVSVGPAGAGRPTGQRPVPQRAHVKGAHAAANRFQQHCRRFDYVLKADIRKYFPSIDHEILKGLLARKLKDRKLLSLLSRIIDGSNPQEPRFECFPGDDLFTPYERRRGIPIGNLTSQFFANVYLNGLDHFIKEVLRIPGYVRYCDDFALFADDKEELWAAKAAAEEYLAGLRLKLHPGKCYLQPVTVGTTFVGYRIFPSHRLLAPGGGRRFQRRLKKLQRRYQRGEIGLPHVRQSVHGWLGHAKQADTFGLRRALIEPLSFRRFAVA